MFILYWNYNSGIKLDVMIHYRNCRKSLLSGGACDGRLWVYFHKLLWLCPKTVFCWKILKLLKSATHIFFCRSSPLFVILVVTLQELCCNIIGGLGRAGVQAGSEQRRVWRQDRWSKLFLNDFVVRQTEMQWRLCLSGVENRAWARTVWKPTEAGAEPEVESREAAFSSRKPTEKVDEAGGSDDAGRKYHRANSTGETGCVAEWANRA